MLNLRTVWGSFVLAVELVASAFGAEPEPIRLPASVAPVAPSAITQLAEDAIFVIECDTACMVLASRDGFVSILEEAGPLRIRGRFVDGTKVESRSYKAKQLWIIEAVTAGEVEILIVPDGAKDPLKVIRRTLVVGGSGPRPPPAPQPLPPVPPPVDPLPQPLGLSAIVANAVRNVPASERGFAAKLAENYRIGATNLANGTWPVEQAIKKQSEMNTSTPGYKLEVWRGVFRDIADRLAEARNAGQFTTQKQFVAVWAELSLAFSVVAK